MGQDKTTLWTERLILRLPQESDFEAYAAIWADPEVVRYIGAAPRSRARCRDAWEKNLTSWKTQGYGNWMIEGRESAALIGQVGFFHGDRGLGDDFDPLAECGWAVASGHFGKGFGAESVLAAHGWWDQFQDGGDTVCIIDVDHTASVRLAQKAGYRFVRRAEYMGDQVDLFRRGAG